SMGLVAVVGYALVLGFALFAIEPFYQEAVAVFTPLESRGLSYGYTYLGMFGLGAVSVSVGGLLLAVSTATFFVALAVIAAVGAAVGTRLLVGPIRSGRRSTTRSTPEDR
ncbi:MAG: MFS transporter, partial [Halobacteriota archaeon]